MSPNYDYRICFSGSDTSINTAYIASFNIIKVRNIMKRIKLLFTVLWLLIGLVPVLTFAQTSSTITVNYAALEGASNQVASGGLHGISAEYPAQYLIDGIKVNSIRGADYYAGGYLPNYYESATYNRAHATGAKLMIGLYYYKGGSSYRPGDNGDWDTWRNIVTRVYDEAQQKNYDIYSWIPWNEPRLQWDDINKYMQAHDVAYKAIKSRNSSARVQAPEDYAYNYDFLTSFLTFCRDNGCLPDILAWHELSQDPVDIDGHCGQIRSWMQSNGITPMPIAITEYQGSSYSNDNTSIPGVNVYYLAEMERAVKYGFAFGLHACWSWVGEDSNFIATLGDMANKDGADLPRGLWWNYNAYKDMTGRLVQVSVSGANGEAFASLDTGMQRSIVLIGTRNYETSHNVTLNLNNIPSALSYNGKVNIRAELIPNGMVVMSPVIKLDGDYSGSSVSLSLPTMDPKSAYMVYISPATTDAPKISYEAESLNATYTSERTYRTFVEETASDGQAVALEATNNGDYVEFRIPSMGAGVYNLTSVMKRELNRGFIQLYINGKSVCPPEDEYGSAEYYENDFGNISVGSGDLNLRFVVVNKNPYSSNRWMVFDRFDLSSPSGIENPTPTPITNLGDVNNDGSVTILDALLVAQFYVGLNPTNFDQSKADTNCDSTVSIVDALLIAQYYVGLINSFC